MEAQLVDHYQESVNLAHDQQLQQLPPIPPSLTQEQCTLFLHRGLCMYSKKSYGMSHGSYYKIFMILRWPEVKFSKIDVFRAF